MFAWPTIDARFQAPPVTWSPGVSRPPLVGGRRKGVDRTREVAQAALACFRDGGYRLTQMVHVSERMGVSVGSIYRYVESKEALFHIAALEAVGQLPDASALPIRVSGLQDTAAVLAELIAQDRLWPVLSKTMNAPPPEDLRAEAYEIAGELYDAIAVRAPLIALLDSCAQDVPELAEVFNRQIRHRLMNDLVTWVLRRKLVQDLGRPDAEALARGAMEAVAWLAKNRPYDPTATEISDDQARAAAMRIFANALTGPPGATTSATR
jgi:AcrR family transcriptional regulator